MPPVMEHQPQTQPIRPKQPSAAAPRVRRQGHLSLVDWEGVAPTAPAPARMPAKSTAFASPLRRTWVDRAYDRAALILLAVTALGVAASLVQH